MWVPVYQDPVEDQSLIGHVGWHPQIITSLLNDSQYRQLAHIFSQVQVLLGPKVPGDHVVIAAYCRSGVHRSAAVVFMIERILQRIGQPYHVPMTEYWSKWWWEHHKCQGGGGCAICNMRTPARDAAMLRAWGLRGALSALRRLRGIVRNQHCSVVLPTAASTHTLVRCRCLMRACV